MDLLAFVLVAGALTLVPGADTALVVRTTVAHGRGGGVSAVLGIQAGTLVHGALAGVGLSVVLARSAVAFQALKLAGAAYLVLLGLQGVWRWWRGRAADVALPEQGAGTEAFHRPSFVQGALTNLLNPKVALFYLLFLPQFVDPAAPVLAQSFALAAVHVAMGGTWLTAVAAGTHRVREKVLAPRTRLRVEGATGALLAAFGARLALSR